MRVGAGGCVDAHTAAAGTWSHGCTFAAGIGAWSIRHMGACVVALVGARTSAWAHASWWVSVPRHEGCGLIETGMGGVALLTPSGEGWLLAAPVPGGTVPLAPGRSSS